MSNLCYTKVNVMYVVYIRVTHLLLSFRGCSHQAKAKKIEGQLKKIKGLNNKDQRKFSLSFGVSGPLLFVELLQLDHNINILEFR